MAHKVFGSLPVILNLKMKILYLHLNKEPFDVMVTGEKNREYRNNSFWIRSRLFNKGNIKDISYVKFVNGYGKDRPYFVARFEGLEISKKNYQVSYSNGFSVLVRKGDYRIILGKIIEKGNCNYYKQLNWLNI